MTSDLNFLPKTCDIFCAVVDNFGDIGVSWRLARQLANEHGIQVRLWIDELGSFAKLCHEVDITLEVQSCRGVEVRRWHHPLPQSLAREERGADNFSPRGKGNGEVETLSIAERLLNLPDFYTAELVIEAFACKLPENYIKAMAVQEVKPVWLNLEYLSAEDWVEGCHKQPSPHPLLPLTKYYFFPGFTEKTGGLLLEQDLLVRRDVFQADRASLTSILPSRERKLWRNMGIPKSVVGELCVSLFSYENDAVTELLHAWEQGGTPVLCCVPEGRVVPQVAAFFGRDAGKAGDKWQRGNLRVQLLPFVEQDRYDELLWACDINFVRGEDSCVRAQWAGKPFVWHIYPQHDGVHLQKLRALSALYGENLSAQAHQANENLWLAWNGEGDIASAWQVYASQLVELKSHASGWSQKLAGNNLALNLLDFFSQIGKMRAFEI